MDHPGIQIASPERLAEIFADEFAAAANLAVARRGRFGAAIPGGSVAEKFLPRLAAVRCHWDVVHLFWCDERAVSLTDPVSNAGLAARLLAGGPATLAVWHPMPADDAELGAAAERYSAELALTLGGDPRLDLALLGVGEDGHVASIFPGHPALAETQRTVLPIFDSPKPPSRRLTLTLPVLAGARLVVVAAFGATKAQAIRDAVTGARPTPAARIVATAERVVLLLDESAASLLDEHRPNDGRAA